MGSRGFALGVPLPVITDMCFPQAREPLESALLPRLAWALISSLAYATRKSRFLSRTTCWELLLP